MKESSVVVLLSSTTTRRSKFGTLKETQLITIRVLKNGEDLRFRRLPKMATIFKVLFPVLADAPVGSGLPMFLIGEKKQDMLAKLPFKC